MWEGIKELWNQYTQEERNAEIICIHCQHMLICIHKEDKIFVFQLSDWATYYLKMNI